MKHREINLAVVAEVANALGELNDGVVFVGGAIVGVYADDPAADTVRPTEDVDLVLMLVDLNQIQLDEALLQKGFQPDMNGHAICSYRLGDIAIDIMSATDSLRGPSNRWYSVGFESLQKLDVEGIIIQVLSAPAYIATKFEAFNDRGQGDHRFSHDFEDIIYVVDNRMVIVEEVLGTDTRIREFLVNEFRNLMKSRHSQEIIESHLNQLIAAERYPILLEKLKAIVGN